MNFTQALIAHLQGERVECKATDSKWGDFVGCFGRISVDKLLYLPYFGWEFRIKPRTIRVNGVEVPAPERVAPKDGDGYFVPQIDHDEYVLEFEWAGYDYELRWLNIGLVYLDKESAIARAKAMLLTQE